MSLTAPSSAPIPSAKLQLARQPSPSTSRDRFRGLSRRLRRARRRRRELTRSGRPPRSGPHPQVGARPEFALGAVLARLVPAGRCQGQARVNWEAWRGPSLDLCPSLHCCQLQASLPLFSVQGGARGALQGPSLELSTPPPPLRSSTTLAPAPAAPRKAATPAPQPVAPPTEGYQRNRRAAAAGVHAVAAEVAAMEEDDLAPEEQHARLAAAQASMQPGDPMPACQLSTYQHRAWSHCCYRRRILPPPLRLLICPLSADPIPAFPACRSAWQR